MSREFDDAGADQTLTLSSAPVTAAAATVSAWVRVDDTSGQHVAASIGNSATADDDYWALLTGGVDNDDGIWQSRDTGAANATRVNTITANTWHNIVGVEVSATSRFVHVDASASIENTTNKSPDGVDQLLIGAFADSTPSSHMDGSIMWVAVWNIELVTGEIQMLADGKSPLRVRRENLQFFAPLWQDEDRDIIGNNDLTSAGSVTVDGNPEGLIRSLPRYRSRYRIRAG